MGGSFWALVDECWSLWVVIVCVPPVHLWAVVAGNSAGCSMDL